MPLKCHMTHHKIHRRHSDTDQHQRETHSARKIFFQPTHFLKYQQRKSCDMHVSVTDPPSRRTVQNSDLSVVPTKLFYREPIDGIQCSLLPLCIDSRGEGETRHSNCAMWLCLHEERYKINDSSQEEFMNLRR